MVLSLSSGWYKQEKMKINIDKLINAATGSMETGAERLSKALRRLLNILIILAVVIASIYMIKREATRTWGVVLFILSFAFLYSYVVRRRGSRKR